MSNVIEGVVDYFALGDALNANDCFAGFLVGIMASMEHPEWAQACLQAVTREAEELAESSSIAHAAVSVETLISMIPIEVTS